MLEDNSDHNNYKIDFEKKLDLYEEKTEFLTSQILALKKLEVSSENTQFNSE